MGKPTGKNTAEADAAAIAEQQKMERTQGEGLTPEQIRAINLAAREARKNLSQKS